MKVNRAVSDIDVKIIFRRNPLGGTEGYCLAVSGHTVLYGDLLNIANEQDRAAFLQELAMHYPGVDTARIRQLMFNEMCRMDGQPGSEPAEEVDVSRTVRPQLFHTPKVSGLLVPIAEATGEGRIVNRWLLCVQWAGGNRDCLDLVDHLDAGDERIWFNPMPSMPNGAARWSQPGRIRWLEGHTPKLDEVFTSIAHEIANYLEFPPDDCTAIIYTLALWVMLTYLFPIWPAVPYLSIGGPLGSGKSRLFEVLAELVRRPLQSSNMTASTLFRTLDAEGGTLLLDEAETLTTKTPGTGEILSVLLSAYKRGGRATRLEKAGNSYRRVFFDVYGPKALAAIASMPPTLASRCIRITMFRAGKTSAIPKRRIDCASPVWVTLRDELHCMALSHGARFVAMADWLPDCEELNGRDLELWLPILAIAKLVEDAGVEGLIDVIEAFAVKSIGATRDDAIPEADEILLRCLHRMRRAAGVTAGEILGAAKKEEPSLFTRYTARGVSAILRRYGLKADRAGGRRLFRVTQEQWEAIAQTYGIEFDPPRSDRKADGSK
jgi:hypothetical protein